MAFRFEKMFADGELVVFEEVENAETGAMDLVTTFCDSLVSADTWRKVEREARAAWKPALDPRRGLKALGS